MPYHLKELLLNSEIVISNREHSNTILEILFDLLFLVLFCLIASALCSLRQESLEQSALNNDDGVLSVMVSQVMSPEL